ncbi:hypothetical protein [Millisia brevis]|uniref:hypothetical protein n=1 Tax=Millisia brevis TaxID=264148 RepID=UPI0012EED743|nr:hypothetical protein [Millisia brevis]
MSDLIDRRQYGVRAVCGTDAVDLIGSQRGAAVRHTEVPGASAVSSRAVDRGGDTGRSYAWTCVGAGHRWPIGSVDERTVVDRRNRALWENLHT